MNNGQKTDQQTAFPADQTLETNRRYTSRQLLAVFWPYLQPHRLRIALAILALVLVAGALLGMGRGLAYLVDEGLGKRDPALLDRAVMATAMIAVVLAFGSYLRTSMVNKIGEMVLADIRRAILVMPLPYRLGGLKMPEPVMCYPELQPIPALSKRS